MKKTVLAVLALVCVFFSGCGETALTPPTVVNFLCDFTADYQGMRVSGSIQRGTAGMLLVSLREPKTLEGLLFSCNRETTTVSLGSLSYTSETELLPNALFTQICDVLDDMFTKTAEGTLIETGALFTGKVRDYGYRLITTPDTGAILSIEIPDTDFSVEFSGVRKEE